MIPYTYMLILVDANQLETDLTSCIVISAVHWSKLEFEIGCYKVASLK